MDDDIRENLKEVGRQIISLGEDLENCEFNANELAELSHALGLHHQTLATYVKILSVDN